MGQFKIDNSNSSDSFNPNTKPLRNYEQADSNGRKYIYIPNNELYVSTWQELNFEWDTNDSQPASITMLANHLAKAYLPDGWVAREYESESSNYLEVAIFDPNSNPRAEFMLNKISKFVEVRFYSEQEGYHMKGKNNLGTKPAQFFEV